MTPHASSLVTLGIPALALGVVALIGWAIQRLAGGKAAGRFGRAR